MRAKVLELQGGWSRRALVRVLDPVRVIGTRTQFDYTRGDGDVTPRSFPPRAKTRLYCRLAVALLVLSLVRVASPHGSKLPPFSLVSFDPAIAAPDFSLTNLHGTTTNLSQYRGHWVLLNFWATWCPPCVEEMPAIEIAYQRFRDHGFVVLGVASDPEGAAKVGGFVTRLGISFPILLDSQQSVSTLYGARNLPVTFLVNPLGQVVAAAQGARDWDSDKALATLEEYMAGG